MRIRFGYVAMALEIPEGSPNKTVTATNILKITEQEDRFNRLRRLVKANLENQLRVLRYNKGYKIDVYRFTSKLVPLATHKAAAGWNYLEEFNDMFKEIGDYVKDNKMRVSAHPDHFSLLNSPKDEIITASVKDLEYHAGLFDGMGLGEEAKLVLHVGGLYREKEQALGRFKKNFALLPKNIKSRLTLENDDKSYSAADVLALSKEIRIPMVLDVHHHDCHSNGESLADLLPEIFLTWNGQALPPKIHISSPKDEKNRRAHADFVNAAEFVKFLRIAKQCLDNDFDVMIEAKQKDRALQALMKDLSNVAGIKIIEQAAIEI